ncbi:hypothetical protein [Yoonia sp.]
MPRLTTVATARFVALWLQKPVALAACAGRGFAPKALEAAAVINGG